MAYFARHHRRGALSRQVAGSCRRGSFAGEVPVNADQAGVPDRRPPKTVPERQLTDYRPLLDGSPPMRAIRTVIDNIADTDATVLIRGESGVGKDLVARALHAASARREGPFVKVNCAAIPPGLLESELFGHEKGAFPGAHRRKPGQFEYAHQGTISLDEIVPWCAYSNCPGFRLSAPVKAPFSW